MSENSQQHEQAAPGRSLMPPYLILRSFLPEDTASDLLEFALAQEKGFSQTMTGRAGEGALRPNIRVSVSTRELGAFRPLLRDKLRSLVPELVARLRATPVNNPSFEIELVAHNDGAFYTRHIDTQTASDRDHIRVLSAVYYFHAEPKAFSGGALRLYAIGDPSQQAFVDVEPERNMLLVFPAWAPHEVMPIDCPSKRFADSRFAINCWVYRKRT